MKTISISRLVGSEAGVIALRLTKALGYDLVDKKILESIFQQYGLTKFGDLYTTPPNIWDLANSSNIEIVAMLNDTMEALAHRGRAVILGRGGYVPLSKFGDVLNVRLQAPLHLRIERVMNREREADRKKIEALVASDDKARKKFVEMFYGHRWDTASDFDLVIDTGTVSVDIAVEWILEATREVDLKQPCPNVRSARDVKVDPLLWDAIEYALERRIPSWETEADS